MERRAGADKVAEALLARALKECPGSGILLAEDIESADRHSQKRKSVDALSRADGDVHVVVAVARLFAGERKLEKARKWFSRAVALDPDYGDALAALYAFELDQGQDKAALEALEAHATTHEPCHGEHWQAVAKAPGADRLSKVEILKATAAVMRKDYEARRNKVAS
jgi:pre-mRNA-processing factor 6